MEPVQCRMARVGLGLGVRELAALAGVAAMTVTRFENGTGSEKRASAIDAQQKIRLALEKRGVTFLDRDGSAGPGIRLEAVGGRSNQRSLLAAPKSQLAPPKSQRRRSVGSKVATTKPRSRRRKGERHS